MEQAINVKFQPSGRGKAQCPADPNYPEGKALDVAGELPSCKVTIPYPAPECGTWIIDCAACKRRVGVTAAGRPDDPISILIPCKDRDQTKH